MAASFASLLLQNARVIFGMTDAQLRTVLPILKQAAAEQEKIWKKWLTDHPGEQTYTAQMHHALIAKLRHGLEQTQTKLVGAMSVDLRTGAVGVGSDAVRRMVKMTEAGVQKFGTGAPLKINEAAVVADSSRWLVARHASSAQRYAGRYGAAVRTQLAVGLLKEESVAEIAKRVAAVGVRELAQMSPGEAAEAIANKTFATSKYDAERLVFTETAHAANQMQVESLRRGSGGWMKRWDAHFDARTCAECRALDGETVPANANFSNGYPCPPDHPWCRCAVTPWLPSWGS